MNETESAKFEILKQQNAKLAAEAERLRGRIGILQSLSKRGCVAAKGACCKELTAAVADPAPSPQPQPEPAAPGVRAALETLIRFVESSVQGPQTSAFVTQARAALAHEKPEEGGK